MEWVCPVRREGAGGFFKGMLYPILSSGAINSLFFGFYGATLNQLPVRRHGREAQLKYRFPEMEIMLTELSQSLRVVDFIYGGVAYIGVQPYGGSQCLSSAKVESSHGGA
jgi:hypothetical protein